MVNRAGTDPFRTPNGSYLVYSVDPKQNDLGSFVSPGNLFGRTYGEDSPDKLEDEFGGLLGSRMVYFTQPTLIVVAGDHTRTYGEANPSLTYTVIGLFAGDEQGEALTGRLETAATASSNVGAYVISQSGDDPLTSPLGYRVQVIDGTLTITPRPIIVKADSLTKVCGEADPALTYTITSGSLAGGDTLSGELARAAGEDVGVYAINQGTLANPNSRLRERSGPPRCKTRRLPRAAGGATHGRGGPAFLSGGPAARIRTANRGSSTRPRFPG